MGDEKGKIMSCRLKLLPISLLLLCTSAGAIEPLTVQENKTKTIDSPESLEEYSGIVVNTGGRLNVNTKVIGITGGIEDSGESYGIKAKANSNVSLMPQSSLNISIEGNSKTYGIQSDSAESNVVTGNLTLRATSKGGNAYGINSKSSNDSIKVNNSILMEVEGASTSFGIRGENSSTLELVANGDIDINTTSKNGNTYGIYGSSSTLNLSTNKNIHLSTLSEKGNAFGIYDSGGANFNLDAKNISIETKALNASSDGYVWGVAPYGGNISIKASGDLIISTSTNPENDNENLSVYGIMSDKSKKENSVSLIGNEISVITSSSSFSKYDEGFVVGVFSSSNNHTKIDGKYSVSITVNNFHKNNEGAVYGIYVRRGKEANYLNGGRVDIISPKVDINVSGTGDVRGIHVANYTQGSTNRLSYLTIQSDEINVSSTNTGGGRSIGLSVFSDGRLYLDGSTTINADDAIVARGYTTTQINRGESSGKNYTRITGDINFNYDRGTSPDDVNADVSVPFYGKDSYWKGSPKVSWDVQIPEDKPDEKKLTVTGLDLTFNSCAVWMPDKVETFFRELSGQYEIPVNTLELNNGVIRFDSPDLVAAAETVKGSRAIVHTPVLLEGNSVQSSHFVYENTSGNTPEFKVIFSGITADQLTDNVRNELSRAVLKGTVDYKNETNPVISADAIPAPQKQAVPEGLISGAQIWEVGPDGKVNYDSIVEAENTVNSALFDVAVSNFLFYRSQMNDGVASRMGDLRSAPKENGAWVRVFGGENKYSGRDMKLKYTDLEIGVDHFFDKNYYLGGLFTYSNGDGTLSNGSTDHKNYSFGLYGGWLGDNGMYADFVVRYLRLDTDFNILRKQGSVIDAFNDCANCSPSMFPGEVNSGSYKNNAYSASVEIGRRVFNSARSFYVEPQTELRFGRIKSSSYHTNRGVLVKQDKTDSVVGRLGVAVGKVFNENKGNAYFNVSVLHDWKGKIKQTYSKDGVSRTYRDDVGGTWGEFTLGSTYKPSENVSVYGSVKTSVGSPIRNPWQVNLGMRYNF